MPESILPSAKDANLLHEKLVEGYKFGLDDIDLNQPPFNWKPDLDDPIYQKVKPMTNEDLTERKFTGSGTFDALMEAVYNHLDVEYEKGRFSKDDYVKAYIALTEASMGNAVQFLTVRDESYWNAITAQMQAKIAVIQLEAAKYALMMQRYSALLEEAKFANTKMDTLNRESSYNTSEWNLKNMMPSQKALVDSQTQGQDWTNDTIKWTLDERLPVDKEMVEKQIEGQVVSNDTGKWQLANMLPAQKNLVVAQTDYQDSQTATVDWTLKERLPKDKEMVEKQIAGQVISNDTGTWQLKNMLPSQKALVDSQKEGQDAQTDTIRWTLKERLPKDKEMVEKQILGQVLSNSTAEYSLNKLLPAQYVLLIEQGESQRAQTLDTRSDGAIVKGSVGKQKDLYTQQIESYKRDAEYKVGKFYADAFITMKTIDEGLIPPSNFTNASVDRVLDDLKRKNSMVG